MDRTLSLSANHGGRSAPRRGRGGRDGISHPDYSGHDVVDAEKSVLEPEFVVEHEFGHQYWYGMVATNEFENAWMDEGINQYMEAKVMDALYGKATSNVNSRLATIGEQGYGPHRLRAGGGSRSAVAPAWLYMDGSSMAVLATRRPR